MKKSIFLALILVGLLAFSSLNILHLPPNAKALTWIIQTIDASPPSDTYIISSLALDSTGNPHVAYSGNMGQLKYASLTGSTWIPQNVGVNGGFPSLALDSSNTPHISYTDGYLKYATWTGSIWSTQTVDSTDPEQGRYSSLKLDSNQNPHICYVADTGALDVKYASYTGSSWATETLASSSSTGYSRTSLALDSNGNPHACWYFSGAQFTSPTVYYSKKTGTTWTTPVAVATGLGVGSGGCSIALDSLGRPYIAYYEDYFDGIQSTGRLRLARWTGSSWSTETVDSYRFNYDHVGEYPCLFIDFMDRPHISYYDYWSVGLTNYWALKYARWTGSTWSTEFVDGNNLGIADWSSLAVSLDGVVHISYCDKTQGDLKHATTTVYPGLYSATIWAWDVLGWLEVPIIMDGVPTVFSTPHTFSGLSGPHTFTVPSVDPLNYGFSSWSTGEMSTTITVSSAGIYTAQYSVPPPLGSENVKTWFWTHDTHANSVVVGNVDGDFNTEIVTGGYYNDGTRDVAQLCVWNGATLALENVRTWYWTSDTVINSVSFGDVDGDGSMEIVTGGWHSDGARWVAQVCVWDGATLALENVKTWYWTGETIVWSVVVANVDGGSAVEIVTGGYYNDGTRNVAQLCVWNGATLALKNVKTWYWTALTEIRSIAIGNVDGDSALEIVTGGYYHDSTMYKAQLCVWDAATLALENVKDWFWGSDTLISSVAIGNVDTDGNAEIVTGGYYNVGGLWVAQLCVWNGPTLALENVKTWYWTSYTQIWSLAVGDVDGDAALEIVTGGSYWDTAISHAVAQLCVWDGATLTSENVKVWIWGVRTEIESVAVGHVDADGHLEIVTGGWYTFGGYYPNTAQLCVWEA